MNAILRFSGGVTHDPEVDVWLTEGPVELQSIAQRWFQRMRQCGDDVRELIHDGCPVACVEDAPFAYVDSFTGHVNVGFFHGAALEDTAGLLKGSGKRMRHVKVIPGRHLDAVALGGLIDAAYVDIKARLGAGPPSKTAARRAQQNEAANPMNQAAIGFTVKSGWASTVLLVGSAASPLAADCRRVDLSDPADPDSRQPYHAGFGTAREAGQQLSRLVASVKAFSRRSVSALIRQDQTAGHDVAGVGMIVGSLVDPDTIANDHIRIHALEGQLFRRALGDAVDRRGLPCVIWRERDVYGIAAAVLERPEQTLRASLAALGREVDGPWRAEQKLAALAAWLVLAGRR